MTAAARSVLLACCLAAACDSAAPGPAPDGLAPAEAGGKADGTGLVGARPPKVTFVDNGRSAWDPPKPALAEPALPVVHPDALADALQGLQAELPFADYPFSGCHDRAHATWLSLSRSLGSDAVAKVWVMSPTLLTVALSGAIAGPVDDPRWGASTTTWDYHVAAIVRDSSGLRVVDPVLASVDDPLSLDAWFAAMTIPAGSAYAILDGGLYSFNTAGPSDWSGGRMPFNGSMFSYDGWARSDRWLEKNLARDAVAEALLDGPTCRELHDVILTPQALVDRLVGMVGRSQSAGCRGYVEQFVAETARWSTIIDDLAG